MEPGEPYPERTHPNKFDIVFVMSQMSGKLILQSSIDSVSSAHLMLLSLLSVVSPSTTTSRASNWSLSLAIIASSVEPTEPKHFGNVTNTEKCPSIISLLVIVPRCESHEKLGTSSPTKIMVFQIWILRCWWLICGCTIFVERFRMQIDYDCNRSRRFGKMEPITQKRAFRNHSIDMSFLNRTFEFLNFFVEKQQLFKSYWIQVNHDIQSRAVLIHPYNLHCEKWNPLKTLSTLFCDLTSL